MGVKIYDKGLGAFKDAETPLVHDGNLRAWKESTGLAWNEATQAWEERWSPPVLLENVPLVPTMTSNTEPSGIASQSSVYSSAYANYAYRVFSNPDYVPSRNDYHIAAFGQGLPQWLEYQFAEGITVKVKGFKACSSMNGEKPTAYHIEGSTDGIAWLPLTGTLTDDIDCRIVEFNATQNTDIWFNRLRFVITGRNGYLSLSYLQYYGDKFIMKK